MSIFKDIVTEALSATIEGYGDVIALKDRFDAAHTKHRTIIFDQSTVASTEIAAHMQEVFDVTRNAFSIFLNNHGIDAVFREWVNDPALYAEKRFRDIVASYAVNLARTRSEFSGLDTDTKCLAEIAAQGITSCPVLSGRERLERGGDRKMTAAEAYSAISVTKHHPQIAVIIGMLQYTHIKLFEGIEKELTVQLKNADEVTRKKIEALQLLVRDLKHPQLVPISAKDDIQNNNFSSLVISIASIAGRDIKHIENIGQSLNWKAILTEFFTQTVRGNLFASQKKADITIRCPFHASYLKSLSRFAPANSGDDNKEVDGLATLLDKAKQHGHFAGSYFQFVLSRATNRYYHPMRRFMDPQNDPVYKIPLASRAAWRAGYNIKRMAKRAFCPA